MNDTLKAAGRIGAELGAAKAEVDRLREVLSRIANLPMYHCSTENDYRLSAAKAMAVAALSQQAEPAKPVYPPKDTWPEWANWCGLDPSGCWVFYEREPVTSDFGRTPSGGSWGKPVQDEPQPCWKIMLYPRNVGKEPEPTDTYTAVDMATAAAQGFRDGQAAVEQAAVKDEREAFEAWMVEVEGARIRPRFDRVTAGPFSDEYRDGRIQGAWNVWQARAARPAQTEQATVKECLTVQPMAYAVFAANGNVACFSTQRYHPSLVALEADGHSVVSLAPIAQTAPQHPDDAAVDRFAAAMKAKLAKSRAKGRGGWDDPNVCSVEFLAQLLVEHLGKGNAGTFEDVANFAMMLHQRGADPMVLAEAATPQPEQRGKFAIGDRVKKTSGSEWVGHVCGTYSTPLTPEGYAVESEAHAGSVQIYPAKALEVVR